MFTRSLPKTRHLAVKFVAEEQAGAAAMKESGFHGKCGELLLNPTESTLSVGLGSEREVTAWKLRQAGAVAGQKAASMRWSKVVVELNPPWCEPSLVEGVLMGGADLGRSGKKSSPKVSITFHVPAKAWKKQTPVLRRALLRAEAINEARRLGNLPGNECGPGDLARQAKAMSRGNALRVEVLQQAALKKQGLNALLAVGGGSSRPPTLITMEFAGGRSSGIDLLLVGKGVTFDTGGICLKSAGEMWEMIFDKAGATAVLGAMSGIAKLKPALNVVAVLPCVENMPSSSAYRPGDRFQAYDGTLVEVENTDAEGRLILADALAWAIKKYRPKQAVDIATLTGAVGVALGNAAAGFWCADESLSRRLLEASGRSGERIWPMPFYPEYDEAIKGRFGGIRNTGGSRRAGACTAAAFLKHFVKQTSWAHLDIAEVAYQSGEAKGLPAGATGFGVGLILALVELLEKNR